MSKVLVIDSDATRCEALKTILEFVELKPVSVCDPNRWREALAGSTCFDLVMLGSCGDERRQRDLLRLLNGQESNLPVIALRPEGPESGLARETRSESVASVSYPLRNHELQHALQQVEIFRENRHLAGNPRSLELFRNLVGSSEGIRGVRRLIEQVAGADATVLLLGESGTGKEVVARNIHYHSARRYKPFVPVNCGAIPADLLESELFGHERGAFTGAISARRGRFEMADGGTLFLDEIGDMPLAMQVKLLRVLQERTFERVGSNKSVSVDVRIIGATHSDLEESIALGKFRDDLYYRLNVFPIEMPPLRSRTEDLSLLVNDLLVRMENEKRGSIRMTPAAMDALGRYPWPGNVRELANLVERLTILYTPMGWSMPTTCPRNTSFRAVCATPMRMRIWAYPAWWSPPSDCPAMGWI